MFCESTVFEGNTKVTLQPERKEDKKQLLSFVNKSDKVIDVSDLKDAYPNVMEDLKVFIVFFLEIYTMSLCVLCFKIVLCCAVSKIFRRNLLVAIKH